MNALMLETKNYDEDFFVCSFFLSNSKDTYSLTIKTLQKQANYYMIMD